jgi:hypothetical protein
MYIATYFHKTTGKKRTAPINADSINQATVKARYKSGAWWVLQSVEQVYV